MRAAATVIAWWFLSVGNTYGPGTIAIPVGPFADRQECEKVKGLVDEKQWGGRNYTSRNYTSWCWWDGKP